MDSPIIHQQEYIELLEAIRSEYGYDFTEYAEPTMKRRIANFMNTYGHVSVPELNTVLVQDESAFELFVQHMSVTVTEMFRDPLFYKKLRELASKHLATYPILKIWLAGCATGQEAYSVAIVLREAGLLSRSIIYATDINQQSLHTAKQGIYPLNAMQKYTKNYLESGGAGEFSVYYTAQHHAALFDKTLSQNIVFAPHNLATDKSFNEFQLIICRNVIMYFNQQLQNKVISLFHESLITLGFLGLGDKESLLFNERKGAFEEIDRKQKIYRKINHL